MGIEGYAIVYGPSLKEDVKDVLFQITPTDTPFYHMIGDGEAKEVVHQWLRRDIRSRQVNAFGEGAAFVNDAGQPASRQINICQIFRKTPSVTGTTQAVSQYAIDDSFLDEMEQAMAGFVTDMDLALVKGSRLSGSTLDTASTRFLDGLIYFLSRSSLWSRSTDATLTEQGLNDLGQTIWEQGVLPRDILCGITFKRRIAGFAGWPDTGFGQIVQRMRPADDFTLAAEVDVYHTDVIDARVHVDRNLGNDSGFSNAKYIVLFDRDMFQKAWLRTPFSARRPYTNDSEDGVILSELTLTGGHERAGGWAQAQ